MTQVAMKREAATNGVAAEIERPWLWRPGQSGNPAGRPKGAKNKSTRLVEALFEGAAEELVAAAVQWALGGDKAMLRFCLSRLLPPARHRCVEFDLPDTSGMSPARAAAVALGAVLKGVAAGEIAPAEAKLIATVIERARRLEEDEIKKAESRSAEPARATAKETKKAAAPRPVPAAAPASVFSSVFSMPGVGASPLGRRAGLLAGASPLPAALASAAAAGAVPRRAAA